MYNTEVKHSIMLVSRGVKVTNCLFCHELEGESTNVFHRSKSGLFAARWDQFPVRPGHIEIVPTYHVERVQEMSVGQLADLMVYVREVMNFVEELVDLTEVYWQMSGNPVNDIAAEFVKRCLQQLRQLRGAPEGYTIGINDGEASGQTLRHVHCHIIPRWLGDVTNPEGGLRRIFPDDLYAR